VTPTLATLLLLAAEDPRVIRVHDSYTVTESSGDPAALQPEVADRVAARLGMTPLGRDVRHRCYFHRPGIDPHEYCFSFERGTGVYRYSVSTSQHANVARFALSAYRQEIDPQYRDDPTNFMPLPQKTSGEFWQRTFINMGYGAQYVYQDNPLTDRVWVAVGFGYLWEGLHYIPIFAGPFLGKTPKDKLAIPLIGLGSLLFWKLTFNGLLVRSHLTEYISVAGSGYQAPRGIRADE
jgi:hypothetical protein